MRHFGLILAAALLAGSLFSAGTCAGATPAGGAAATTGAAATAPAETTDPKGVLTRFLRAVYGADEKTVFANIYLTTDEARGEAEAVLGDAMGEQKWRQALAVAFKTGEVVNEGLPEGMAEPLAAAKVTLTGDTAQIDMEGHVISMMHDKGAWKVDFYKTQRDNEGPLNKDEVAATAAKNKVRELTLADLKAGKFKTAEEATQALETRMAAVAAGKPAGNPDAAITVAGMAKLKLALEVFEVDNGRYPTTAEGLDALVKKPAGLENWAHAYIDKVPMDGWGHAYIYVSPGKDDPDFDLSSAGPDGKAGTADDITGKTRTKP